MGSEEEHTDAISPPAVIGRKSNGRRVAEMIVGAFVVVIGVRIFLYNPVVEVTGVGCVLRMGFGALLTVAGLWQCRRALYEQ